MIPVAVALLAALAIFRLGWPLVLQWSVGRGAEGKAGGIIARKAGHFLILLSAAIAAGLGSALVVEDDNLSWFDPEPAVAALAVAVGVVFAFSRLFPPAFWINFHDVTDFDGKGDWNPGGRPQLQIGRGQWWAVFMKVYNAGIVPWANYRITVKFDGCSLHPKHDSIPASDHWAWPTMFRPLGQQQDFLQVQATNTLVVAEAQTMRFVVKAPDQAGKCTVVVSVVADGRLGESKSELKIDVKDGLPRPSSLQLAVPSP